MDLIMYAGYTRRTQILKECMTVDSEDGSPTKGQKFSCMGDEWHMHSEFDKGLTSEAFVAPPGEVIDVAIQKNNYEEMEYPYTNCSSTYNIDTSLCQANCLRRVQVMKC